MILDVIGLVLSVLACALAWKFVKIAFEVRDEPR